MGKVTSFMVFMSILCLGMAILPLNVGSTITGTAPPLSGDWVIANETVITDETIVCDSSIIVNSGGSLKLVNSKIEIQCDTDGEFGIIVNSGGAMEITDGSEITRAGVGNFYFMARTGASFTMSNSALKYCGYEHTDYRYNGLYLECDSTIEQSTIDLCQQGVIAENETITISHSTVSHSSQQNIEGRNAELILDSCTFNATSESNNVELNSGCTATLSNCIISFGSHNGIWADDDCDLTINNNFIHNNTRSGLWINDSTVVCNSNTISDNGKTDAPTWDESGHGFAGFNSDVEFKDNTVAYNYGHNFETTASTAVFNDNTFYPSIMKCNVEFFEGSVVTAKNNYIDGAGHNCFWVRDGVTATIEDNIMKNSPHNGIWAGNDCTMIIRNNIIENCAESGIYSYNSTLTIENNEIINCTWWGIQTEGCTVTQSGNTFADVDLGEISYQYFIKVKVKDDAAVSGATVTIKDSGGNIVYATTTDTNGETSDMLFTGFRQDTGGTSATPTYTVEVEKDDMSSTSDVTFDETETISVSLAAEEDGDGEDGDMTLIIIIVVVVVVVLLVIAVVAMKKKKG